MANTYELIGSTISVGSAGAASIDFNSIPGTYNDLCLIISARNTSTGDIFNLSFNGSTSNFSGRYLYWAATTANSGSLARYGGRTCISSDTANAFASTQIYIPNYAGSAYKPYSSDSVSENNTSSAPGSLIAGLWSNTAAITSISLTPSSNNFTQYSTASLYGIKNS